MGVTSLIVKALLTFVFVFAGLNKITNQINPELHHEMIKNFVKYYQLWGAPILGNSKELPAQFRFLVGTTEVASGVLLLLPVGALSQLANYALLGIMFGALATHLRLNDPPAAAGVVGALILLLVFSLYLSRRPSSKPKRS